MGSLCLEGASRSTLLFNPLRPCFGITRAGFFFTLIKISEYREDIYMWAGGHLCV